MASKSYPSGINGILSGSVNLIDDTISILLTNSSYTYANTHTVVSNITGEVANLVGTGYSRRVLTGKEVTTNVTNVEFTADNITYPYIEVDDEIYYGIVYKTSDSDQSARLLFYLELTPIESVGADILIDFDDYILRVDAS